MKAFLLILTAASTFAQGTINFQNRFIPNASGFGTYDVPIFGKISTVGAGPSYTAGLFLADNLNIPLATTSFQSDVGANPRPEFFEILTQPVSVPGVAPGQTAQLAVRVWYGNANEYDANLPGFSSRPSPVREVLDTRFTSQPLGGGTFTTPGMTGWGGQGFSDSILYGELRPDGGFNTVIPEPSVISLGLLSLAFVAVRRKRK